MSSLPPALTSKFRVQLPATSTKDSVVKLQKNSRIRRVCTNCRSSKLRCDRKQPKCSNCSKKSKDDTCWYPDALATHLGTRGKALEERLHHLELILESLPQPQAEVLSVKSSSIHSSALTPSPAPDTVSVIEYSTGTSNITYVGPTHWSAILHDINQLRIVLGIETATENPIPLTPSALNNIKSTSLITGSQGANSLASILSDLPPRADCGEYLEVYFEGGLMIAPYIHTIKFRREYSHFWLAPSKVHPLWLSSLFSVCCMGSMIKAVGEVPLNSTLAAEASQYHAKAGECLILGKYHEPQRLSLEALGLYIHYKCTKSMNPAEDIGTLLSMVARMAYELGYHRDPENVGGFSAFEGEMRRRFWYALRQVDIMTSFQRGLPSIINDDSYDTKPPRNLRDTDFDEDTRSLLPARTDEEDSDLLYFVVKNRQLPTFSKVCRVALSFKDLNTAEVLDLDQEIRNVQFGIPWKMKPRPFSTTFLDPPFLIMTRLYIEFISLKSIFVLHSKYMSFTNTWNVYCCMEAACSLVEEFIALHAEFSPSGQLAQKRWMLSNFIINDFLLAAMVLCLIIHKKIKNTIPDSVVDATAVIKLDSLLKRSLSICDVESGSCHDAQTVAQAIRKTLAMTNQEGLLSQTAETGEREADTSHEFDWDEVGLGNVTPEWLHFVQPPGIESTMNQDLMDFQGVSPPGQCDVN